MSNPAQSSSVDRFVSNARRLVIIQIIISIIALIAAAIASGLIYKAILEQNEAAVATALAKDAKAEADAARKLVDVEVERNEVLQGQNQILRQSLVGIGTGSFDTVIADLQEQPDANTYPLIATAHYLAASKSGDGALQRYVSASAALVEAIRLDQAAVASAPDTAAHRTSLYLEFAGIQCAAVTSSGVSGANAQAENLRASMTVIEVPEEVSSAIEQNAQFAAHPVVKKECTSALMPVAAAGLGVGLSDTAASPPPATPDDTYRIERVFMHVADEAARPLAQAISARVAENSNLRFPGTERIVSNPSAYKASVRYYYAEQKHQAEKIQADIVAAARAAGASWGAEAMPLIKLNIPDLPRERIEVWLPASAVADGGRATSDEKLTSLSIVYVQRSADGLSVSNVLDQLVPSESIRISNPQISGDRNDALACSPNMSGAALGDFKTLTKALIANGVPIRRITAYRNPAAKPSNQVEILHSTAATGPILTPAQVDALTTCQIVG